MKKKITFKNPKDFIIKVKIVKEFLNHLLLQDIWILNQ